MRQPDRQLQHQLGFSIIELLLALALGMLVVAGIVQLFVGNAASYNLLTGQARMQENGRMAMELMTTDVRNAGYFGCAPERRNIVYGLNGITNPDAITDGGSVFAFNAAWPIQAFHPGMPIPVQANLPNADIAAVASDVLTIRRLGQPQVRLVEELAVDGQPLVPPGPGGGAPFSVNDVLVIADCEQAAVLRVTNVVPVGGNFRLEWAASGAVGANSVDPLGNGSGQRLLSGIGRTYGADAIVAPLLTVSYFVAESQFENSSDNPVLALWQKQNDAAPQELIAGIEALQVRFGVDLTPNQNPISVNSYVNFPGPPPSAPSLRDVVSVRMTVTANSIDEVSDAGEALRRTFTETIFLRNANPRG